MAEGFLDFTPGQVLTAAQVDDYLMRQAVMRFADSAARTTALSGVLVEGMMSYLKDTNTVEVYDGTAWVGVGGVKYGTATGGSSSTITVGGESYTLLTFTASGTLTVTNAGVFDVLVVGGGGGGGTAGSLVCGGGGAGGYREYSKIYFDANQTVTIGAGGAVNASRGGHSRCGQPFAAGGGGTFQYGVPAFNGASGGGDGYAADQRGNGDGVSGNDGGFSSSTGNGGGGGGGAGAVGGTGSASTGGAGGIGLDASAFRGEAATTTYYSGGGGAEGFGTRGLGGLGGGGNGKDPSNAATAGAANTGGGGGGDGAAGGSGIVLVRFKD